MNIEGSWEISSGDCSGDATMQSAVTTIWKSEYRLFCKTMEGDYKAKNYLEICSEDIPRESCSNCHPKDSTTASKLY
jgi:hypothetical protein